MAVPFHPFVEAASNVISVAHYVFLVGLTLALTGAGFARDRVEDIVIHVPTSRLPLAPQTPLQRQAHRMPRVLRIGMDSSFSQSIHGAADGRWTSVENMSVDHNGGARSHAATTSLSIKQCLAWLTPPPLTNRSSTSSCIVRKQYTYNTGVYASCVL